MSNNFEERLRRAAELLESIANNRELLANVSEEDQRRLLRAAGEVFEPDDAARRRLIKAMRRHHKAAKTEREEVTLAQTGIRKLRSQALFTTPNVPPERLRLLRSAFQKMIADPEFRAEAEKLNLPIEPKSGEEMQKVIADMFAIAPETLAKIRELSK